MNEQKKSIFGIPIKLGLPDIFTDKTTRVETPDGLFADQTDYSGPLFLIVILAMLIGGGYLLIKKK